MNGSALLYLAANELKAYYTQADDVVRAVIGHAATAAGAAALAGALPGAGSTAAAAVAVGAIVTMYVNLGNMLGSRLGKGLLKSLASAIVADLAGSVAAALVVGTVLSFIPGLGTIGAAGIMGLTSFCYVYLAGILYIKMVTKIAKSGKSIEHMSEADIQRILRQETGGIDMKAAVKEAASAYKKNKA